MSARDEEPARTPRASGRQYANALALLPTDAEDLDLGMSLFERHPRLSAFESVLAAAALNRDAEALISADAAFGDVAQPRWINPVTPALDSLITH
jgi:predicted nucleic acid-binding protein